MRKLFMLALLLACCAPAAWAQNSDEFPKVSFFGGYSYNRLDATDSDSPSLNGFDAQVTGHLNKYFGIKGDFSGHYDADEFQVFCVTTPCPNFKTRTQLYNILGGPEVRARNSSRVTPFAHALFGAAHLRNSISGGPIFGNSTNSDTRFAAAFGGGLDVRANDRFDIRVVQVDYNPIFFEGGNHTNGVRVSVGVVIK